MARPAATSNSNHDVVQAFAESHPDVYGGACAAVRDQIEQRRQDSGTTWHSFGAHVQEAISSPRRYPCA